MRIAVEDQTLREGQQRAGASFSVDQKVQAARALDDLGVDAIQVGFPIANDGSKEVIDRLDVDADLTGTARALERDIDACLDAGVDVVGFGVPSSDLQRERILGMTRGELKDHVATMYDYCQDAGLPVSVGTMDGFRTDPAFINELIDLVGVEYFGIADTVGIRNVWEVEAFLDALECDLSMIRVHFHYDIGFGTANAVAAVRQGVGKVDVTCGGIGERVGNVPLEEFIVALELADINVEHNLDATRVIPQTKAVLEILDEHIPPHKPIIGATAFAHESGMHTAAMLDEPATFEPFDPARFGGERHLLFGPATGQGAARRILEAAGIEPTENNIERFLGVLHGFDEHVGFDEAVAAARDTF